MNPVFKLTSDPELVRLVYADALPALEQERGASIFAAIVAVHTCVLAFVDGELAGLYLLHERNEVLAELHFVLVRRAADGRRAFYGAPGRAITKAFLAWVWANTSYERLTGAIDASNTLALRHALKVGFTYWGRNERAMRKGGRLCDAVMVGLSRG